ncbi:uncharacterized protein A4U43_C07F7070 [Asparagus officinalis]|uniref:PLAC8 family protein n=1 Tax=Asparagus officinalis TaxID=4686 RepID=A0A5P1EA22_ASPOF|nr:uncharacterized protein LOC109850415 [Asparagus officinalis]ONK62702.1 uncharacterized protein A4U43_C07F7070 [Asparagus officinalis]
MVSTENGKSATEIQEDLGATATQNGYGGKNHIPLYLGSSQRGLLDEKKRGKRFQDKVIGLPKFMRFGSSSRFPSASSKFWKITDENQDVSCSAAHRSTQGSTKLSIIPFVRKINWTSLWEAYKQWIRNPLNMALFVWIVCVAISGAILFLVMTGMLNSALPRKSQRDTWFEVNNQILNALFTLMCLYQHPKRFHHLVLLCRWRSQDILKLRKIYCKDGTEKPNEWKHMMIVVVLLHINCFAQYALCGLNIGYPRSKRPAIGVGICVSIAIAAPAVAGVYNILSPLGKEYDAEIDQEAQDEKKYSFISRADNSTPVSSPQWIGGIFDFWDDISLAYMSVFCSCCVFGWNMDRLGFGNMYVHIVTFLLFCLAPFFVFNLAALNIDNEDVREALGISGFILCIFGLLYGGFWRIQMRKRFNLPGDSLCCGRPSVTDCFQWLCCCFCSLAQEVRTADYYEVVDDKLCLKKMSDDNENVMSPLPREDGSAIFESSHTYWGEERSSVGGENGMMKPPIIPVIQGHGDLL